MYTKREVWLVAGAATMVALSAGAHAEPTAAVSGVSVENASQDTAWGDPEERQERESEASWTWFGMGYERRAGGASAAGGGDAGGGGAAGATSANAERRAQGGRK